MIVITTPTGQIGRQVLGNVLDALDVLDDRDAGAPIRVIARDPARLSARMRERVEVIPGSHSDIDVVNKAFAGADTVFWLAPSNPRAERVEDSYLDFTRPACDAFKSQGVERVVGISALGRGVTENAGLVSASLAMDDLIAATGVAYRALTLPSFMDNVLRQTEAIKNQGTFFGPTSGDRRFPACATRDIAAVAAGLLLDPSWSGVGSVPLLGPEDLSLNDMAQIMSEVLGTPVRFQEVSAESFKAGLARSGMSDAMVRGMADMMAAKDNGLDNAEPRTPESTTPTSFRQFCEEVLKPAVLA